MTHLFAIKNMKADQVNLLMNDFAAGLPSPLSFLGLADAVARSLDLSPWSARVLPIIHGLHVSNGRTKPEMEYGSGAFGPIETMETLTGYVDVSLLISIPGCNSEVDLAEAMEGRRIAGGLIQNDEIRIEPVPADGSCFKTLKRGVALIPPRNSALAGVTSTGGEESLRAVADTLFPSERPAGRGWIVPVAVGYRLLENSASAPKRSHTRSSEIPHVFAEPMVGVAELISVRNQFLTELSEKKLDALFWTWKAQGTVIAGHQNYHPDLAKTEAFHHG